MPDEKLCVPIHSWQMDPRGELAFLIAQVGSFAQNSFGKQVDPFGLRLAHVGVLKAIFKADGLTQRALGDALGMFPSNLVKLIDELEEKELVRRRKSTADRRLYALELTKKGQRVTLELIALTRAHEDHICASLTATERLEVTRLLQKIAAEQGLRPGVHPELPGLKPVEQQGSKRPKRKRMPRHL